MGVIVKSTEQLQMYPEASQQLDAAFVRPETVWAEGELYLTKLKGIEGSPARLLGKVLSRKMARLGLL